MSDPRPGRRTSGWLPLEDIVSRGDPAGARLLTDALTQQDKPDRYTHGFHTYPAGLHPDAARDLLAAMPPGPLLDPFCGGGTSLVEGLVAGRAVTGLDVSPVAALVSRTRTWLADDLTPLRSAGRKIAEAAKTCPDLPPREILDRIGGWYEPHVLRELEGLRRGAAATGPGVRTLLGACLSAILVKVSHRQSDTSRRRVETRRPPETTAILFHKKVRELGRRLEALRESTPGSTPRARIVQVDARSFDAARISREDPTPFAAALTSPPYPGVYDYLPLQDLRLTWLKMDDRLGRRAEIAARRNFRADRRRALARWRDDTAAWTARVAAALKSGGQLAIVIGDGLVGDRPIDTLEPSIGAARAAGLRAVASASGRRPDHARRASRWEHLILLEKP